MLTPRKQFKFVLALPIINVIADSTQGYASQGLTSPGYLRALIIILFVLFHFRYFYRKTTINQLLIFSLIYYFILSLFSSNVGYVLNVYLKYFIATIMFPIGYHYFNSFEKYCKLIKVFAWTLGIYVFFLLFSNVFGLGSSDYLEDSVYFGAGRVNATKAMMILALMFPLVFRFDPLSRNKRYYIVILLAGLVFIFLGIKRSALLGIFFGYFVYFILTPYKTKMIKVLSGVGLLLALSSPLYFNQVIQRFEVRKEAGRFDLSQAEEEEGRVIELYAVIDAFVDGNLGYKLFGAEFFNSRDFFKTSRMLHTDYATMFQGSGLVGLFLFLLFYYLVFNKSLQYFRLLRKAAKMKEIMIVSIVLIIGVMITGLSGTVTGVGLRSIAFLFWGASFSCIEGIIIKANQNQLQTMQTGVTADPVKI